MRSCPSWFGPPSTASTPQIGANSADRAGAPNPRNGNDVATHGWEPVTGEHAWLLAVGTMAVSIVLSVALFLTKVIRWRLARARAQRRALYIGALGEMLARGVQTDDVRRWAKDPVFIEVVVEYMQTVAGDERDRLERIVGLGDIRPRLASRLLSANPGTRLGAASSLAVLADRTVGWVLLIALRDRLPEVRIQAASGLSSIKSVVAIPRLIDLLENDDAWVSARIADQLVHYGSEAVPHLLDAVRRGATTGALKPATVQLITRVLGLVGDLRACPVLRPLLDHTVPEIRIAAASALGSAGTVDAVKPLIRSLRDPDWRVRARAAAALGTFSAPASVRPLFIALDDGSWWVRQNAAEALTEIPGGREALVDAISYGSAGAREASITQLGLSGSIRAARDRLERGEADPLEQRLISLIDRIGQKVRHAS